MEGFIILSVLGLVGCAIVLPIVAIVRTQSTRRRLQHLEQQQLHLDRELQSLKAKVASATIAPVAKPGPEAPRAPQPTTSVAPPPAASPRDAAKPSPIPGKSEAPAAPERPAPAPVAAAPHSGFSPPPLPSPLPKPTGSYGPTVTGSTASTPTFNWERFVGTKLIAWLGGLVLFLAAAYFIKYSFDHDLVPPVVRVSFGFLLGIGLVIGGFLLRQKAYTVTAQTFCGTGVVILYAVTFACRSVYHFEVFSPVITFGLMCLITGSAFLLAVRMTALVVAVLGMLGGFLTPVILSTGQDNALGLFGYIALLDAGLIGVALSTRWHFLIPLAAAGTGVMELGWTERFLVPEKLSAALGSQIGFNLLFALGVELAHRRSRLSRSWVGASAGLALTSLVYALWMVFRPGLALPLGWSGAIALVGDLCLIFLTFRLPAWSLLQALGALLMHGFLAAWMAEHLTSQTLFWVLGGVLVVAVVHTLAPVLALRLNPAGKPANWIHLLPPAALLLMLLPIFKLTEVTIFIWPLIFLIDLLAIGLALATRSVLSVLAVLIITGLVGIAWILRIPVSSVEVTSLLVVIGGLAAGFLFAGMYVLRRLVSVPSGSPAHLTAALGAPGGHSDQDSSLNALLARLPALSALMPFVLLMLVVTHLRLPQPSQVFALALALTILLLSVARSFRQPVLALVALVSITGLQMLWHMRAFDHTLNATISLGWHLVFSSTLFLFPFLAGPALKEAPLAWIASALAFPLHFLLFHRVVQQAWPNGFMGLLPAAFALPTLGALRHCLTHFEAEHPQRNRVLAWYGGCALFFVTLIFPIQFDRQWITVSWALEGMALCWLYHRVPHDGLRATGVGLLVVSFVRLAVNPAVLTYHTRSETPLLNWYLYSFGAVILALFTAARLLAPPRDRSEGLRFVPLLNTLGTVLLFLLMNVEIADYFTPAGSSVLTFKFSGNLARDMCYTIGWGLFALGLVSAGIRLDIKAARFAGLALIGITLLKLILHDLSRLGQLYRIGALAAVAVVAILASFLYQRFVAAQDQTKKDSPPPTP